jgi:hypothetical protein
MAEVKVDALVAPLQIGSVSGNKYVEIGLNGEVKLNINNLPDYIAGQVGYDPASKTVVLDSGISGVRLQAGQEEWWLVCNNTLAEITNGTPCYASGVDGTNSCLEIDVANSASFGTSAQVLGLATHTIGIGEVGLVTYRGLVNDVDTSLLAEGGVAWLGAGVLTNTQPLFPLRRVTMGTVIEQDALTGKVMVSISRLSRNDISKSYPFTSTGVVAGTFWIAGFYDFADASVSLTQASTTQTYGLVDIAKDAHAGMVASAAGVVVGGGQVGLRIINSILDSETGTQQVAGQSGIITEDITTLATDMYMETVEKWSGIVTYELYVVSGAPTAYSLTFNYGFAKYDDIQDRDYTIKGFECKWQGNANSSLDIALIKHTITGWTYAATGFVAGNGDICRKSVDQQLAGDVANNADGAWKRVDLDTYIAGKSGLEGHIVQVITGANGTIQVMSTHIDVVSEEIDV